MALLHGQLWPLIQQYRDQLRKGDTIPVTTWQEVMALGIAKQLVRQQLQAESLQEQRTEAAVNR